MAKAKPLNECRTAGDFDRAIRDSRLPCDERQTGSHRIYRVNGTSIPIPQHNGDIPVGTRRSIVRMLIRAGLLAAMIIVVAALV